MKSIYKIILVVLCLALMTTLVACEKNSQYRYEFTHENGNVSVFIMDFENNTGSYEGYPMWSVLMNGVSYKWCDGAIEKCSGTIQMTEDFGDDGKFYDFIASSDRNWRISFSVPSDQSYIRCYINGVNYTFTKE